MRILQLMMIRQVYKIDVLSCKDLLNIFLLLVKLFILSVLFDSYLFKTFWTVSNYHLQFMSNFFFNFIFDSSINIKSCKHNSWRYKCLTLRYLNNRIGQSTSLKSILSTLIHFILIDKTHSFSLTIVQILTIQD